MLGQEISQLGKHQHHCRRVQSTGTENLHTPRIGPRLFIEAAVAPMNARNALKAVMVEQMSQLVGEDGRQFLITQSVDQPSMDKESRVGPTECANRVRSQHKYAYGNLKLEDRCDAIQCSLGPRLRRAADQAALTGDPCAPIGRR